MKPLRWECQDGPVASAWSDPSDPCICKKQHDMNDKEAATRRAARKTAKAKETNQEKKKAANKAARKAAKEEQARIAQDTIAKYKMSRQYNEDVQKAAGRIVKKSLRKAQHKTCQELFYAVFKKMLQYRFEGGLVIKKNKKWPRPSKMQSMAMGSTNGSLQVGEGLEGQGHHTQWLLAFHFLVCELSHFSLLFWWWCHAVWTTP